MIERLTRHGFSLAIWIVATTAVRAGPEASAWRTNYAEARKIARQTHKPLFVVFRCQH
jgi:hypothetical protein